jgi:hypothetical protein
MVADRLEASSASKIAVEKNEGGRLGVGRWGPL